MLKTKKIFKKTAIVLTATVILLFSVDNLYWLTYYNKFKTFRENSGINECFTLEPMGKQYMYSDYDQKISYGTISPGCLETYGIFYIRQEADIDSPVHEEAYDVGIQVVRTLFRKQYLIDITYIEDSNKTGPDSPAQKHAEFIVDENMNIIDKEDYSEQELKFFDDCGDTIDKLYMQLNDFFGEDDVTKL